MNVIRWKTALNMGYEANACDARKAARKSLGLERKAMKDSDYELEFIRIKLIKDDVLAALNKAIKEAKSYE